MRHVLAFLVYLIPTLLSAQEPIRFGRTPDISPDGKLVAFSYKGDIWTVEAIGGVARPITMHEAHDSNPCISPDGRWIAFSSNRHGQYDIFVVPTLGGKVKRLTFDSANDVPSGWTPDSKSILFTSVRTPTYPTATDMYAIDLDGSNERKLPYREAKEISISPAGGAVAFTRGPGLWYRKNYRGSSNDDLWLASPDGTVVKRITDFNGQDTAPMFSPDGKGLYYISESLNGTANIVRQELSIGTVPPTPQGSPRPITMHKDDSVRKPRLSANGEWLVYECAGDLWISSTKEGKARKLAIEVHADDKSNVDKTTVYRQDISEYALSNDENAVAFVIHGEVFAMPLKGGKANRLTETNAVEHGLAWSPDGKKLLFVSDRTGFEELYLVESDDPENADLTKALRVKTKQLTNTPEAAEIGASFSPDGNSIVFIRAGKLHRMKADGTEDRILLDQQQVFDYDWSPDGKWLVYSRSDGHFSSELYIIASDRKSDDKSPPVNITRHATSNADVSWGNGRIAFQSNRRGGNGTYVIALQKPGNAPPPGSGMTSSEIDFDEIHLRASMPANIPSNEGCISRNGRMIAFQGVKDGVDLWVAATDGSSLIRVTTGNTAPRQIRWTKGGSVMFLDNTGSLRTVLPSAGGPPPGTIAFSAKMTINRDEEFLTIFDQSWRLLQDNFYDQKHHDADWKSIRNRYRELVPHVALKEDLYALITLMLGELNASHLGITGSLRTPEEMTAELGLLFDETYKGPGLKIAEVLKRGPADKKAVGLNAGDVILSIDRTELTPKTNLAKLLNSKVNDTILLEVTSNPADPKAKRKTELQATDRNRIGPLMYDRWVSKNAEAVTKLSGGKLGYIHIKDMDEPSLDQFVRSLYSDHYEKDAIVIDVRNNGGGFTHDQVLNYLGAKEHTFFKQRNGGEGTVMRNYDRKWTKPSVVLINNRSYSDAEIFPAAYRTLGYGKIVGQSTGGLVIGTSSTRLIDGSQFRLPRTGVFTSRGINMEKEGVPPDIAVESIPEELAKGNDAQLTKAVEVLSSEVAAWKKSRTPTGGTGTSTGTGAAAGSGK